MDETGWKFELRFTGARGVHPDKTYTISRSDDMLGDGGCLFVLRMGTDAMTEVTYSDMSRISLRDISVEGTAVARVRRALNGNIVGEWLKVAVQQATSVPPPATPASGQTVSDPDQSVARDLSREAGRRTGRAAAQKQGRSAIRVDSTFGRNGAVFADFSNATMPVVARALVAQSDGSVIVAGTVGDEQDPEGRNLGLIRFDENGRRDPDFGNDGYKVLDLEGVDNVVRALALQPDGKIIVAGEILDPTRGNYDFALVRLDASGQVDSGFGGGVVTTEFCDGQDARAYAVTVQPDGKIVAVGHSTYYLPNQSDSIDTDPRPTDGSRDQEGFAVARYNADGSRDTTFAVRGRGTTLMAVNKARARARAMHAQQDGRILAAGFASTDAGPTVREVALARLDVDGNLDETYGSRGRVYFSSGGTDEGAHALAVQPDGRVVIAGVTARDSATDQHFLVARLAPDGTLDETFGVTGIIVNRHFVGLARGVVICPDGRIVAAGSAAVTSITRNGATVTREQIALVSYLPDGSVDETFGTGGVLFIDLGGNEDSLAGLVLSGDKILIAGTSRTDAKSELALIRLVMH